MKRILMAIAFVLALPAQGGQPCAEQDEPPAEIRKLAGDLAREVRKALDASGTSVAIVARAGMDLSRWGLLWSHAGIAFRDHPAGRWTVVHELNDCGGAESALHDDSLDTFYADVPVRWEGLIVEPAPALQTGLTRALAAGFGRRLHEPSYNLIAYPFSSRHQNSNQWVLEMVATALGGSAVTNRVQAQNWLRHNGYVAAHLNIPAKTRQETKLYGIAISFDDQPQEQLAADRVDTVTVESIVSFVEKGRATRKTVRAISR